MKRKLITRLDIVTIALFFVISIAIIFVFMSSGMGNKAVVSVDGKIVGEYYLKDDLTEKIKTDYGFNTVVISNGECYVLNADCRDGVCINRGKISKVGESIVCLPHKLIVEIK